jgi:hypothetical protein
MSKLILVFLYVFLSSPIKWNGKIGFFVLIKQKNSENYYFYSQNAMLGVQLIKYLMLPCPVLEGLTLWRKDALERLSHKLKELNALLSSSEESSKVDIGKKIVEIQSAIREMVNHSIVSAAQKKLLSEQYEFSSPLLSILFDTYTSEQISVNETKKEYLLLPRYGTDSAYKIHYNPSIHALYLEREHRNYQERHGDIILARSFQIENGKMVFHKEAISFKDGDEIIESSDENFEQQNPKRNILHHIVYQIILCISTLLSNLMKIIRRRTI